MNTAILAISLYVASSLAYSIPVSQAGCFGGTEKFIRIIYDVTTIVHQKISQDPAYFCSHDLNDTGMTVCSKSYNRFQNWIMETSPTIQKYFEPFQSISTDPRIIFSPRDLCTFYPPVSNHSDLEAMSNQSAIIVYKSYKHDARYGCKGYCSSAEWLEEPFRTYKRSFQGIEAGLELSEHHLECMLKLCPNFVETVGMLIINVPLQPIATFLSPDTFSKRLGRILTETVDVAKNVNPQIEVYIRLYVHESRFEKLEHAETYRAYIAKFAKVLVETDDRARFILETFSNIVNLTHSYSESRRRRIYPYVTIGGYNTTEGDVKSSCELENYSRISGSVFENILVEIYDDHTLETLSSKLKSCRGEMQTDTLPGSGYSNIVIRHFSERGAMKLIHQIKNSLSHLKIATIFFEPEASDSDYATFWSTAYISLGCITMKEFYVGIRSLRSQEIGETSCSHWNMVNPVSLLEWRSTSIISDEYLSYIFHQSLEYRRTFLEEYPQGTVLVRLPMFPTRLTGFDLRMYAIQTEGGTTEQTLFCESRTDFRAKAIQNVAVTWSEIHNFPVIAEPLIDIPKQRGWWYNIETDPRLNRTITDFNLLVHRNVQAAAEEDVVFPNTFPCLERTDHLNSSNIFRKRFSGVTLRLNSMNSSVSTEGIVALQIALFGRFNSVEIANLYNRSQLIHISDAIGKIRSKTFLPATASKLYIQVSELQDLKAYFKILDSVVQNLTGIHFAGWENQSSLVDKHIYTILEEFQDGMADKFTTGFGITIENCTSEINAGLHRVKILQYLKFVSYIVCKTDTVAPNNEDQKPFQIYLDTHFYIQKYFKATFGLNTIFRVSFVPQNDSRGQLGTESYLKFINYMNEYAKGYGVMYFMGNAFPVDGEVGWSWWSTGGYEELTRVTYTTEQYTVHSSDYMGPKTTLKDSIETKNGPTTNALAINYLPWVIGALALLAVVLTISGNIWMYYRRNIHADDVGDESIELLSNQNREIPKGDIELGDVIGGGNFAFVHKGLLRGAIQVAVKVPKPGVSFESFEAEVKILKHLGSHENLIRFIGACTKKTDRDVFYIITEFCPKGSLASYLQMQQRYDNPGLLTQLNVFSYEIASGMEYIAEQKVVHADLSARNVLLTADMTCKIGDFGLSRKLYENVQLTWEGEMPWRWMPPETLRNRVFSTKSDVWSFGVTLWEIFSLGQTPYIEIELGSELLAELETGFRLNTPERATIDGYNQMMHCWNNLPEERPTFKELSRFFKSLQHSQPSAEFVSG